MKFLKYWFLTTIVWLTYKAAYDKNERTDKTFSVEFSFKARWYSPLFWLYAIIKIPVYLLLGGLIEWLGGIVYELRGDSICTYEFSADFKPKTSWIRRQIEIWKVVYGKKAGVI